MSQESYRVEPETGCWVWVRNTNPQGYGQVKIAGKAWQAHRHEWTKVNGPVPPGLQLDHLCENKSCVNPAHLEAVTPRVNVQRAHDSKKRRKHPHP